MDQPEVYICFIIIDFFLINFKIIIESQQTELYILGH